MRRLRGLPFDVWIIFVTTLVNRVGTMALPFLVLYLTQELKQPATTAGLALTVYGVGTFVSAPLAGYLCDRFGPMRVMQVGLTAAGIVLFLVPLAPALPSLLALIFLWAVIGESVRPASLAALTNHVTLEQRKVAIALNRFAINLGMSVGPAVGGFLSTTSFPMLFVVDGATSVLAAGVLTAFMTHRQGAADGEQDGTPHPGAGVLRDARMLAFMIPLFFVFLMFRQLYAALPLFLVRDLQLPATSLGLVFVVNTAIIICIEIPLNLATANWTHRAALTLGSLLIAAGFGALSFVSTQSAVLLTVVVWTFGEMIFSPAAGTYVADLAPNGRRGEYMGAYWMVYAVALMIGPWAGTTLLEHLGAPTLWAVTGASGVSAAALIAVLVHPTMASERHPAPTA